MVEDKVIELNWIANQHTYCATLYLHLPLSDAILKIYIYTVYEKKM